jgi:hypothetical protein
MSHPSPLLLLVHLLTTWTPSSRTVLWFARLLHPIPLLLQVHGACHRATRGLGAPAHATCGPGAPASATRGTDAPAHATRGPNIFICTTSSLSFTLHRAPPGVPTMTSGPRVGALSHRVIGLPPRRRGP